MIFQTKFPINYNSIIIFILGPSPAPIEKIRGLWRSHIIIKSVNKKSDTISKFIFENIGFSIFEKKINGVQVVLDVDPISMM